ncbi:MAG: hypothetical protein QOE97_2316 [Pseudonocardiales bacterium]|jgi:hypothetical protein|nr:hypothetical protein [Pseudonocardiales bacterium]
MSLEFAANPDPDDAALHICGAAELVQAVPYLLGFHPTESLVIVAARHGELLMSARIDLDDVRKPMLPAAIDAALRAGAHELVAIVYTDAPARRWQMPHQDLVGVFLDGCVAAGAAGFLAEIFAVSHGRWFSYRCDSVGCACPPDGLPVDAAPSTFVTAATVRGMVALPSRTDVLALLEPGPDRDLLLPFVAGHENATVQAALDGQAHRSERAVKRAIFAAARAVDQGAGPLPDERVARFGVALTAIEVRDSVWLAIDSGRLDGRELWRDLGRRLPPPYDAAPLFLTGWSAWRHGNGVVAGEAARRALVSDPGYSAAELLVSALAGGVDPTRMPALGASRPRRSDQPGRTTGGRREG